MTRRFAAIAVLAGALLAAPGNAPSSSPEEVAFKRAHIARVLAELETRDVSRLAPAQRAARAATLKRLRAYAERGRFPRNTKAPHYALPYLIDEHGTRCALAYLIDRSGEDHLLARLAREGNHEYVHALLDDAELRAWFAKTGLTADEAAYIQAPGLTDDNPAVPVPTSATPNAPTTGGGSGDSTWATWWNYNRDAFTNLRERYHGAFVTTGKNAPERPRRPGAAELRQTLLPFLARASHEPSEVRATAIMAYARAARAPDAPQVVAETLDYLRDPESGFRDLMILALGVAPNGEGVAPLLHLLKDDAQGRRILKRASKIPERTRAFAAVALGQTGHAPAIEDLIEVLDSETGHAIELRVACLSSLGQLARDADGASRARVVGYLQAQLKRQPWTDTVLAAIPTALAKTGDPGVVPQLAAILERFRGPKEVRQSCAIAAGLVASGLEASLVDALIATARRDTDTATRRFAIVALGELCLRDRREDIDARLVEKVRRFYAATLEGVIKQPRDTEWFYLGAGLFARRFPAQAEVCTARLVRASRKGPREERAAATIALGITDDAKAVEPLRLVFRDAKDKQLRGYAAEALGMLRDRSVRDDLLKLAVEDPSDGLRYQAAIALGYLADSGLLKPLVAALEKSGSQPAQAALTRVIGDIGDKEAIAYLIRLASDKRAARATRERALGALGIIGQEKDRAWTFGVRRGANFVGAPTVLATVLNLF